MCERYPLSLLKLGWAGQRPRRHVHLQSGADFFLPKHRLRLLKNYTFSITLKNKFQIKVSKRNKKEIWKQRHRRVVILFPQMYRWSCIYTMQIDINGIKQSHRCFKTCQRKKTKALPAISILFKLREQRHILHERHMTSYNLVQQIVLCRVRILCCIHFVFKTSLPYSWPADTLYITIHI